MNDEKTKDRQSRKFQLTINNPLEKGYDPPAIEQKCIAFKGFLYACYSYEQGKTHHVHLFIIFGNPKKFSTIKNAFPEAHIEGCKGSSTENRDYIFKEGKWQNTQKEETKIEGEQYEIGILPKDQSSSAPEKELLLSLIQEGYTNYEIITEYPEYLFDTTNIDKIRLLINQEKYKNEFRNLFVTYIYGVTGSGKTRGVMEQYGYEKVFRATDYLHPFDTYKGEDILLFEEFTSSIQIQNMLNYLDGYPCKLPSRYVDKYACYTKVFILSNLPLEKQYPNVQEDNQEAYQAFLRRINQIIHYKSMGETISYDSTEKYLKRFISVEEIDNQTELPFD